MTFTATCAIGEVSHNPSRYRAEQYDSDLGLYYLRARYYNPTTGRFLSRDPEDGKAADPKTLHKYLYADGDPVDASDPTGQEAMFETAKILHRSAVKTTKTVIAIATCISALELYIIDLLRTRLDWVDLYG